VRSTATFIIVRARFSIAGVAIVASASVAAVYVGTCGIGVASVRSGATFIIIGAQCIITGGVITVRVGKACRAIYASVIGDELIDGTKRPTHFHLIGRQGQD
jgi:hypothetical protein